MYYLLDYSLPTDGLCIFPRPPADATFRFVARPPFQPDLSAKSAEAKTRSPARPVRR